MEQTLRRVVLRCGEWFYGAASECQVIWGWFQPLFLSVQLLQFEQLKDRVDELYNQAEISQITSKLPKTDDFSKALYILDSGQNDLHYGLATMTRKQVEESIPYIINQFSLYIERLYQKGARVFWIHNTGPIGCLPFVVVTYPPRREAADQKGCIKSHNELAQEFNKQLKEKVSKLRTQLSGFVNPLGYCCSRFGDSGLQCWKTETVNGTEVFGTSCTDPSKYISWDGIHCTEAANKWIANHILEGSLTDPPVPLAKACRSVGSSGR